MFLDLKDKKFGRLLVKDFFGKGKRNRSIWTCVCDCGNVCNVTSSHLVSGDTTSCGCYKKEVSVLNGMVSKKENKYSIINNIALFKCSNSEDFFEIDKKDFDLVINFSWRKNDKGYIVTSKDGKTIYLHLLIMSFPRKQVDHVDRNKNNNKRENLRLCEPYQNSANKENKRKSKSGYVGVRFDKRNSKWYSSITVKNKSIFLGYFNDVEFALVKRLKAEKKYFGEFAPQKSLFEKYNI